MKKLFVICMFFILGSGFAFSQNFSTDKGAMILGGTASFTSEGFEGESRRSTSIMIKPVFDYFIMQNLFVGGSLGMYYSSNSSFDNTDVGIGPEIGYAFGGANSSMFPFLKAGFNYFSLSTTNNGSKSTSSITVITLGGGMVFEIIKHIGIVGFLSYNIINQPNEFYSKSSNTIELSFGFYGLIYK